jgi:branched-chain amino acid aminotransferase
MRDPSSDWIIHDGEYCQAGVPILKAGNRGLRYGDGLFETLLVQNGRIRLSDSHFDRLFAGLRLLKFEIPPSFTRGALYNQVIQLCETNGGSALSRVRLTVFRADGTLFDARDHLPHYVIESAALDEHEVLFNEQGLRIGIYPDGRKARDPLANLKSGNFLPYVLAAIHAREHLWDDCLVLNDHRRIADSCIANVFYTRGTTVYTPPLTEGCVAGIMRRHLIDWLPGWGFSVREQLVTPEDLRNAEGIFLTNALKTIRWVGEFQGKILQPGLARELHAMIHQELDLK